MLPNQTVARMQANKSRLPRRVAKARLLLMTMMMMTTRRRRRRRGAGVLDTVARVLVIEESRASEKRCVDQRQMSKRQSKRQRMRRGRQSPKRRLHAPTVA